MSSSDMAASALQYYASLVRTHPDIVDEQHATVVIKALKQKCKINEALRVFEDLRKRKGALGSIVYTAIISTLCTSKCLDEHFSIAFELLRDAQALNLDRFPNVYALLISLCGRRKDYALAKQLYQDMQQRVRNTTAITE
jgi:pentatricopeptide repeat protein